MTAFDESGHSVPTGGFSANPAKSRGAPRYAEQAMLKSRPRYLENCAGPIVGRRLLGRYGNAALIDPQTRCVPN